MSDYYEIDFLDIDSDNSGDAIIMRYQIENKTFIHVVDGGYQSTGEIIVNCINNYYNYPKYIDNVILTHQDNDHAGGLRKVLEEYKIGTLWMLRPWLYAEEIIDRFSRFTSVENLKERLKEIYSNITALEEIANKAKIKIMEPFQGAKIGAFTVLSPSKDQYLDLVVNSEKTPDTVEEKSLLKSLYSTIKEGINYIRSAWGDEIFPEEGTSIENEMSIVQYSLLCGNKILLTGDAGREALKSSANFAPFVGLSLPGIDRFQVPHHGSRHNVSSSIFNTWLGNKLPVKPQEGNELFISMISASKKDKDHPRKSVIRALIHRGSRVIKTKGVGYCIWNTGHARPGWGPMTQEEYPEEQEE